MNQGNQCPYNRACTCFELIKERECLECETYAIHITEKLEKQNKEEDEEAEWPFLY